MGLRRPSPLQAGLAGPADDNEDAHMSRPCPSPMLQASAVVLVVVPLSVTALQASAAIARGDGWVTAGHDCDVARGDGATRAVGRAVTAFEAGQMEGDTAEASLEVMATV
jgi:hypothetical protein